MNNNKDRIIIFYGTMDAIERNYNHWVDLHDNIEVMDTSFIPIRERRNATTTKQFGSRESTNETIDTDYSMVVRYMVTDATHINRVLKGSGHGVS